MGKYAGPIAPKKQILQIIEEKIIIIAEKDEGSEASILILCISNEWKYNINY